MMLTALYTSTRARVMVTASAVAITCLVIVAAGSISPALAHIANTKEYTTVINGIEPDGLPVEARIVNGDQMQFTNQGDKTLVICGYSPVECEPYVKIEPKAVYVNKNSQAFFANRNANEYGAIPDDAGEGDPEWDKVQRDVPKHAYHDHRVHWMGTKPPGSVDTSDAARQKITDWTVTFEYDGTPGKVTGTVYYIGGQGGLARYGEQVITGGAVLLMLVVFGMDAVRRRRRRTELATTGSVIEAPEAKD